MNLSCFFKSSPEASTANESAMTLFRVGLGLMMAFGHGLGKIPPSEGLIGGVGALGFPAPVLFAWLAALAEFAGGLFVAVGLLTRASAFLVGFTMLVAAFGTHLADPFNVKEMSLLYLLGFTVFTIRGSGRWSVDHLLFKKK